MADRCPGNKSGPTARILDLIDAVTADLETRGGDDENARIGRLQWTLTLSVTSTPSPCVSGPSRFWVRKVEMRLNEALL